MANEKLFDDSPVPPGDHLRELLREKSWTQDDLAAITGRSRQQINDIIAGRRGITPEMALSLGAAFGVTPNYWLALEANYRLSQITEPQGEVIERAKLYDIAPIKDMQKRGWIKPAKELSEVASELKRFYETDSLDAIDFRVSTRKTARLDSLSPSQLAWCFRAKQLTRSIAAPAFNSECGNDLKNRLRKLAAYRAEACHLPNTLLEFGIRFVVIEPLPGAKIDGAAFWLDEGPAIAVSLRHDRLDAFWFTVMHEVAHVVFGDPLSIDDDLSGDERAPLLVKDEIERRADKWASEVLVPHAELDSFIRRVAPLYSKERIVQFAHRIKMNPGIIVGQLQHRGQIGYHANRDLLVKVREIVTKSAITDGWGQTVSIDT